MNRFTKDGRLIIPIREWVPRKDTKKEEIRYVVDKVYCPNGCCLMDEQHKVNGYAGIRIKYTRSGMEGEFVVSAIEGDFDKIILSGELVNGVKDELYCPHCGVIFEKLVNCNCKPGADMVMLGLSPKLNLNDAVAFCNVTGCNNGAFIKSGEILRHLRLGISFNRKIQKK